jgi:prepilin-type N-terminal cleavage/methylation domain-containing protein
MRKAFTLIELAVAVGILAMVLSFAGVIFKVSINSHRTAIASAEIMQKLRAITDQLDADFRSVVYEYGGYIGVNTDTFNLGGQSVQVNSDCIAFFTSGSFQSTAQYDGRTMAGNVACVFYGQPDPNSFGGPPRPQQNMLLRRQTILTGDAPAAGSAVGEYYRKSLSQWRVVRPFAAPDDWVKRPLINPNNLQGYMVMLMAEGVHNFTIEFAEWGPAGQIKWTRSQQGVPQKITTRAFKFTFTLYDSKGVIKNGRTFTHIVYLGS